MLNIDYLKEAREGCSSLLNESPIFLEFLSSIIEYYDDQEVDLIWLSENLLNVDAAEKWHLDLIGMIVGQPRLLVSFNTEPYFGFEGAYQAETFGTIEDPSVGGIWKSLSNFNTSTARRLNDEEYRRVIKARVIFNNSNCTRNDLVEVINLLLDNTSASISRDGHGQLRIRANDQNGFLDYFISRIDLDDNILPVALGVRLELTSTDPTPKLNTYQTEIDMFEPTYWRVDGAPTMSFSITNYLNGFQVDFVSRMTNDLVGVLWDSKDTKDHQLLSYREKHDYRKIQWSFDIELSDSMPVLNDEQLAPTITVKYKENGEDKVAYIALYNYATNPTGRSSRVVIDWDTVKGGFYADEDFPKDNIQQIFFAGVTSSYDKDTVAPLPVNQSGWLRITNSEVTGLNSSLILNRVSVPNHDIGMCTSYDDHYDLNPQRIVDNFKQLGYQGFINHYCGMSHYPEMNWDSTLNKFQIPMAGSGDLVNLPTRRWHEEYARLLNANGLEPVYSVSWELYSQAAREEWCQRDYNDRLGKTGYTPPSYFMSMCHTDALAYIHQVYKEFANTLVAGNCDVIMQIGEPWWWFNTDDLMPCVYDYQTRLAFNADTGLFAPDLGNIHEAMNKTGTPYDEFKTWLRNKLGQTCQDIRTMLKAEFGDAARITPLIFFPSILTEPESLVNYINFPIEAYSYPNFDFMMTEAYDWIISQPPQLDKSLSAVEDIPVQTLGYPKDKIAYLSGFVPDKAIAYIYGFDITKEYEPHIWQRIFGDISNSKSIGVWKQLIWAYPQVMAQSVTIDKSLSDDGFFMSNTFYQAIKDNTPYPDDILLH